MGGNMKYGNIIIDNTTMEYVAFGRGTKNLIMIPGISEAFGTVKSSAVALAIMYRLFAKDFRVYVFSRKKEMEEGYTIQAMAQDQIRAMQQLGIEKASVMGVSQGGMIAQYMAADYPKAVEKLALAVTVSQTNKTLRDAAEAWIGMAEKKDYPSIITDTTEKSYSEAYIKKIRWLLPVLNRLNKPKDYSRFITQAKACINHDASLRLGEIQCPTLVIGGDSDRVVGLNASETLSAKIQGSQLVLYKGLGHAAYEEAKDFNHQVLNFLIG